MRRAAVAVLVGGFASGGIISGLGHQPAIFGTSVAVSPPVTGARLAAAFTPVRVGVEAVPAKGMKTVRYQGYRISVPGNWPVYFLDQDPDQCVRYDLNAVYLGTPGANQECPAALVGRADTISIGAPQTGPGPGPGTPAQGPVQGAPATAAPRGMIFQNADQHEFAVDMPDGAPAITATYGTDPRPVEQMLASVTATPQPGPAGRSHLPARVSGPDSFLPPARQAPPSPARRPGPMPGFDTCTAPSLHTMRVWRARFSATSIYIGGSMMACDYGNLTAGWVRRAKAMGWSLLPTYVGPQAPCDKFSGKIDPKHAAAQGTSAANQAIADANSFGLGRGSPIYYDIEAYHNTKARCVTAVLTFLDAWTRRLRARGYVSGVYSSAGSAVIDLQDTTRIAGHSLAKPQAIWFALWDNAANLTGRPYMTSAVWLRSARSKQYRGSHVVKVGGIGLDIDSDLVSGPVARR